MQSAKFRPRVAGLCHLVGNSGSRIQELWVESLPRQGSAVVIFIFMRKLSYARDSHYFSLGVGPAATRPWASGRQSAARAETGVGPPLVGGLRVSGVLCSLSLLLD